MLRSILQAPAQRWWCEHTSILSEVVSAELRAVGFYSRPSGVEFLVSYLFMTPTRAWASLPSAVVRVSSSRAPDVETEVSNQALRSSTLSLMRRGSARSAGPQRRQFPSASTRSRKNRTIRGWVGTARSSVRSNRVFARPTSRRRGGCGQKGFQVACGVNFR
jgi:hypothetical protein